MQVEKTNKINVSKLVAHFGGAAELVRKIDKHRMAPITISGIGKWIARQSVPTDHLLDLQELGRIEGRPINIVTTKRRGVKNVRAA